MTPTDDTPPAETPAEGGPPAPRAALDDTPPLLGSWRTIYAVVLGSLVAVVALLWWFTRAWS